MFKSLRLLLLMFLALNVSTLRAGAPLSGITLINQLDSVIFDLSQAVCASGQVTFPVYFKSDDPIYAVDFSLKFNPNGFTFSTVNNIQPGLVTSAYYNGSDSTLRFTSYSITPMVNNSPLVTLRFNLPSANISLARFDSVYTLLNGDDCSKRFINPNLPQQIGLIGSPVVLPGDCSTLFINTQPGLNYLWSTGQTTSQITVCLPGTYSVTVSAVQGCNAVNQLTLLAPSPLPVELLYFKGSSAQDNIRLKWATASELSNDYFTIEKLRSDGGWDELAVVAGSGTTGNESNYYYDDRNPDTGINLYRLSQTDYNGRREVISEARVYHGLQAENEILISPNPFMRGVHQELTIFHPPAFSCGQVHLVHLSTGTLYQKADWVTVNSSETNHMKVMLPSNIIPGVYLIMFENENESVTERLIIAE